MATGSATRPEEHRESTLNRRQPPSDEVFELLSSRRRRYAIEYLRQCEKSADLGELAEMTAARENGVARVEVSSDERKRTYTALQQFHFPKMEKMGFVNYDRQQGVVEPTDRLESVDPYLQTEPEDDTDNSHGWECYYGLASILALSLAGLGWAGTLPLIVVIGIIIVTFGVLSFVHVALGIGRGVT